MTRPAPSGLTASSPKVSLKYAIAFPPVQCPPWKVNRSALKAPVDATASARTWSFALPRCNPPTTERSLSSGKRRPDGLQDIDVAGMGAAEHGDEPAGGSRDQGGVVDDRARAGSVLVEELPRRRGVAPRFARNIGEEVQIVLEHRRTVDRSEERSGVLPGQIGHSQDAHGIPFRHLVLLVPDVRMAVDGGIPLETAAERQTARVVFVPVADDDPVEAVEAHAHPAGVPEKDVRRSGVEEPAVAVWEAPRGSRRRVPRGTGPMRRCRRTGSSASSRALLSTGDPAPPRGPRRSPAPGTPPSRAGRTAPCRSRRRRRSTGTEASAP